MNRILKFRAWVKDGDTSIMQPVEEMVFYERGGVAEINDWWDDSRFILMQYTGLEDKNGVEIYEGDIVRVLNNHKEYEDGEVAMSNLGLWAVRLRGLKVPLCEFIDNRLSIVHSTERIEVIGNIYENPGLLEV